MKRVVSATEARVHLGELMREAVESREAILVERRGEPWVVILSVTEYERLLSRQRQGDWRALVHAAHAQVRAGLGGRSLPPPEEVLAQVRKERDERLPAGR